MMSGLKTKFQQKERDEELRKQSLDNKFKLKTKQQNLIKNALTNGRHSLNRKIKFDGSDDEPEDFTEKRLKLEDSDVYTLTRDATVDKKLKKSKKEAKKGLSDMTEDDRFKLDERFQNDETKDESYDFDMEEKKNVEKDKRERKRTLNLLGEVLGQPVSSEQDARNSNEGDLCMVRFDETNKEHLIKGTDESTSESKRKKQKKNKKEESLKNSSSKPVSDTKFYEVSSSIKSVFSSKQGGSSGFSLLKKFGHDDGKNDQSESSTEASESDNEDMTEITENLKQKMKIDRKMVNTYDYNEEMEMISKSDKSEEVSRINENNRNEKSSNSESSKKEKFFFQENDPRFAEGLQFINKKTSEEATAAAEKFGSTRNEVREIFRLKAKKFSKRESLNKGFRKNGRPNFRIPKKTGHSRRNGENSSENSKGLKNSGRRNFTVK